MRECGPAGPVATAAAACSCMMRSGLNGDLVGERALLSPAPVAE
jgi:hypothetical protein